MAVIKGQAVSGVADPGRDDARGLSAEVWKKVGWSG
jgi:hypothetical protein